MKVDFGMQLAPLDSSEVEKIRAWRNDYRVYRWCRQSDLITDLQQKSWFERQDADPTIKMYAVKTRFEGKLETVGVCGLTSIDWLNRRAEFSLYVGPEHHRKGFGREALRLLLLHAFSNLGLGQVWGETMTGNPAAKVFEEIGFKKDGTRRQFYFKDGAFHDAHLYSIIRSEWNHGHSHPSVDSGAPNPDPGLPRPPDLPGAPKARKRRLSEVPKPAAEAGEAQTHSGHGRTGVPEGTG